MAAAPPGESLRPNSRVRGQLVGSAGGGHELIPQEVVVGSAGGGHELIPQEVVLGCAKVAP
jgi:hypothetical protein